MAKRGRKVKVEALSQSIQEELAKFADYIDGTVVESAICKTAEDTAEIVRANAPTKSGEYKASIKCGWRERKGKRYTIKVYSNDHYQLTHLLENGHATRNGGRTRAFLHWSTGEEGIVERLTTNLKEKLSNGVE